MSGATPSSPALRLPNIPGIVWRMTSIGLTVDCTGCGSAVAITICQSDQNGNAGKPMARHARCRFFRFFPKLLQLPDVLAIIPSSSQSPPPSSYPSMGSSSTLLLPVAPSLLSQPPALTPVSGPLGKKLRKRGPPCAGAFCRRARALRCIRGMCLKHCIEAGGCVFHSTESNDCENEQNHESELECGWADYEPPSEPFEANELLVDNQGFGYEDLQLALKVSLAAQGLEVPSAPPPSLHDILTSVPGPSAPCHALIPSPPSDNDPPPPSQLHCTPSATLTVRKPLKQPRITNQLDPVWALDLRARAQQEIDEGRIAERRKEMERAAKQHFVLNWFDADDEPVMMQWVSNCPFFPQYQLSDDSILIESLGTDISKIDVYEERYARWIPAPLSHTFTLTTGGHIFIRRHGVTQCEGFDELYRASKQSVRPPHMCSNMKGQRDALRATAKQSHRTVTADCDSDLEILEVKPLTNKATGKRRRYSTPSDELNAPDPSRQRLHSQSPPDRDTDVDIDFASSDVEIIRDVDFADRLALSLSPTPPLDLEHNSMSQSLSPSASSSSAPLVAPSVISVHVPIYRADNKREVWPHGMYTVDMATGFRQLDNPMLRGTLRQDQLFETIFGVPYVKATYHQNHRTWIDANPTIRETHERAGRKPAGLWRSFLSAHRITRGEQSKKSKKSL